MKSIGFAVNETVNCDCCPPYAVLTVYDFLAAHSFMNTDTPTAPAELREWLDRRMPSGCQGYDLTLVAGDASPRQYWRVLWHCEEMGSGHSAMAVVSPSTEKNPEFLQVRALLESASIRVPHLLDADVKRGFLLLEDLGNDTLWPMLSEYTVDAWYGMALDLLATMTAIDAKVHMLPQYHAGVLQVEIDLFAEWFVPQLLGLPSDDAALKCLDALSQCLCANAAEQPQVVVHRDFHSRNLMCLKTGGLAVIDFQDAVVGPVTYDPVSLLKDCYVHWPRTRQIAWLKGYQQSLEERGSIARVSSGTFIRWFDLMGLQRHIKVLGIFSRLALRDGKRRYLNDLPLVLAYVEEALALYAPTEPIIAQFREWFSSIVMPACQAQAWYRRIDLQDLGT